MKNKQILTVLFCATISFAAHSQSVKNDSGYRKILISVDAGMDFSQGVSGTVLQLSSDNEFALPAASRGFGSGFDGACFLTKNYGIGLKYRFFTSNSKQTTWSEYADVENKYDYPVWGSTTFSFREQTHAFGPAVYARWFFGQSKWNVSANAGVVYLYNKLSDINGKIEYHVDLDPNMLHSSNERPYDQSYVIGDYTGSTVGFTLSAGIRYQLAPTIGIGLSANGLFASLSRMKQKEELPEEYGITDISRKISRTGIDFSF